MDTKDIEQRVIKVVEERLCVAPGYTDLTKNFMDDLGADSLDVVELIMALEEDFSIDIPDEDAEKIQTVGDAVKYLEVQDGK